MAFRRRSVYLSVRPLRSHLNRRRSLVDNNNNTNEPFARARRRPSVESLPVATISFRRCVGSAALQRVQCFGDESPAKRGDRGVKLLLARRPADPARRINGISQFSSVRERAGEPSVVAASGAFPAVNTLTIFTAVGPLASDR